MAHVTIYRDRDLGSPQFATISAGDLESDAELSEVREAVRSFIEERTTVLTVDGHTVEVVR